MTDLAVILCAGGGTRLRPITADRPKALVPINGETILRRAMRLLGGAGVREIVVATGYRADAVRAALAGSELGATFCHNEAYETTQNSVSLLRCEPAVRGRAFYKLDGDVLFVPEVLRRLARASSPLAVAVEKNAKLGAEEMKVTVEGDAITAFGKGLDPYLCYGESIGIELVSAQLAGPLFVALAAAERSGKTDLYYEDVYGELIRAGASAKLVDVTDLPWIEVDTPDDLERAKVWAAGPGGA
jgi:choline kinase